MTYHPLSIKSIALTIEHSDGSKSVLTTDSFAGELQSIPPPPRVVVMEERPWGEFMVSRYTEEEASSIVETFGTDRAHFYFADLS